jgi:hypothetical protein
MKEPTRYTSVARISISMYTLKLVYDPEPRTQTLKETITYCASIELYTQHRIECFQTSASELVFESERDRMLAVFFLSCSSSFTPTYV